MASKGMTGKPAGRKPKSKKTIGLEAEPRSESDAQELSRKPLPSRLREVGIPPGVREFCALKQIEDEVRVTISLARDHFRIVGEPDIQLVNDPECGEHYIGIHVQASGQPEEVFGQSEAFLDAFLKSIDFEKRVHINLIYHSTQE